MDHKIIHQSIRFLQKQQLSNGSFLSLSSDTDFKKPFKYPTFFSTALILSCLSSFKDAYSKKISKLAAKFLLSQKSSNWSFNYWDRDSKEFGTMPYPDDLDDTFCALAALFKYNSNFIDGQALASVVSILTATEERVGGPYRTWLTKNAEKVWNDVDLAVNANISFFLALQGIDLPNLKKFIKNRIQTLDLSSTYYPTIYPVVYFISRIYKENPRFLTKKETKTLIDLLFSKKISPAGWENPLYSALSITSLLNLGFNYQNLKIVVNNLSKNIKNGLRETHPFCLDPVIKDKVFYSGSPELTTAFCLEALGQYTQHSLNSEQTQTESNPEKEIFNQIILKAKKRFLTLDQTLSHQASQSLEAILITKNAELIVLTPLYFKKSLGKVGQSINQDLIINLGLANLYGWIAYTIYDDFLDDEGDPKKISVANLCLRELTQIFTTFPIREFTPFFGQIMDRLEAANTWEVTYCRAKIDQGKIYLKNLQLPKFDNYQKLADRSLGHGLGPMAILFDLGFSADTGYDKNLISFFENYLIAKQLNDDAHDWQEDLQMGHLNPVVTKLLKEFTEQNPTINDIQLKVLIPKLQKLFWHQVIGEVCSEIFNRVEAARYSLEKITIIFEPSILLQLLDIPQQAAKKALSEREQTLKFLKHYQI